MAFSKARRLANLMSTASDSVPASKVNTTIADDAITTAKIADDAITTRASGLGIWNEGSPEVLVAGANTTLSGSSGSGSPVVFSENGPCVIAGTTLTALAAGQCTVTATTAGNATLKPATEVYVLSVTAPPRKKGRG